MNKKLLALAVAGALSAPVVALADTSNVVIYGQANPSIDFVDGGDGSTASADRRVRIGSNNSHIGFKGTEDLGNGLNAIWQYEQSFSLDEQPLGNIGVSDTTNTQSKRNTWAGLSSKAWGALTFGLQDTPVKVSTGRLDVFGNTLADYRSIFGSLGGSVRAENSIQWVSPKFGGFQGKVLYAARNEAGAASNLNEAKFWSASIDWATGPIYAVLAHERGETANTTVTSPFVELDTTRLGFGYNFGNTRLGLAYERSDSDSSATGADFKRNAWYASVAHKMGSNTIKAAFTHAGDRKGDAGISDSGAKQYSIGFSHAFSKRTELYALYTTVRNDGAATYALAGGATGIAGVSASAAGEDPRGISIGLSHKF